MKKRKRLAKYREELKKQRAEEYRRLAETKEEEKEEKKEETIQVTEPENKVESNEKIMDSLSTKINKKVDYNELYRSFNAKQRAARQKAELLKTREVLTRIYADDISIEEIEKATLSDWQRTMLIIAYYDKNNRKLGLEQAKQAKKDYADSPNKLKAINVILENLKSKKAKVFSAEYYTKVLDVTVDFDLALKISEEKKKLEEKEKAEATPIVETKEVTSVRVEEVKKVKEESKKIVIGGNGTTTNRFTSKGSTPVVNNNGSHNIHEEKVILIKDVFDEEITELRKYIYSLMQDDSYFKDANDNWLKMRDIACKYITKKSHLTDKENETLTKGFNSMKEDYDYYKKLIKAWDILESLIERPITDKNALQRLLSILQKLESVQYLKIDKEKVKKYSK